MEFSIQYWNFREIASWSHMAFSCWKILEWRSGKLAEKVPENRDENTTFDFFPYKTILNTAFRLEKIYMYSRTSLTYIRRPVFLIYFFFVRISLFSFLIISYCVLKQNLFMRHNTYFELHSTLCYNSCIKIFRIFLFNIWKIKM